MIDGLFTEEGDDEYCVLSAEQAKTDSLAGELETPASVKAESGFVGL